MAAFVPQLRQRRWMGGKRLQKLTAMTGRLISSTCIVDYEQSTDQATIDVWFVHAFGPSRPTSDELTSSFANTNEGHRESSRRQRVTSSARARAHGKVWCSFARRCLQNRGSPHNGTNTGKPLPNEGNPCMQRNSSHIRKGG